MRTREERSKFCEYFWFLIQASSSPLYHLLLQWYVRAKWDNHRPKNARPIWKTAIEASAHFYCTIPWFILVKTNNNHNLFFDFTRKIKYMSSHYYKTNHLVFLEECGWLSPESPRVMSVSSHSSVYFSSHGQFLVFFTLPSLNFYLTHFSSVHAMCSLQNDFFPSSVFPYLLSALCPPKSVFLCCWLSNVLFTPTSPSSPWLFFFQHFSVHQHRAHKLDAKAALWWQVEPPALACAMPTIHTQNVVFASEDTRLWGLQGGFAQGSVGKP